MNRVRPMKKFRNRKGSEIYKKCLSGIEAFYEQVQKGTLSNSASMSPDELEKDVHYEIIRKYFKFLYAQYQAKYAELTGALIDSVNKKEFLLFGLCGRSLLEMTAILRYYTKKLQPIIDEAAKTGIFTQEQQIAMADILDSHARGGRFNWNEFHFGNRSQFAQHLVEERKKKSKNSKHSESDNILEKINPEQVNVLTAIEKWATDEPGALLAYEFFCELVHPNLGSNFMVMGSKAGRLIVGKSSPKDVAKNLCDEGLTMVASTAIREGGFYMGVLVLLKETEDPEPYPRKIH